MAGARGPADRHLVSRLFRPRNRHRDAGGSAGWERLRPFLRRSACIVVPAAVALLGVPALLAAAREHAYFAVKHVDLCHRGRLEAETLRGALALPDGASVWDVDVEAAAARLRAIPWVRAAEVRRVLPDRLAVRVREHRPVAILAIGEPTAELWYVAANGRIFAPVAATDGRDLPYLTGLTRDDLDGTEAFGPRAIHRGLALLRLVARTAPGLGPISEVYVGRDGGLTLLPTRPPVSIALGTGRYGEKLARVARVLPLWAGREVEVAAVSVSDNEVIVRTRPVRAPGPTRTASGA